MSVREGGEAKDCGKAEGRFWERAERSGREDSPSPACSKQHTAQQKHSTAPHRPAQVDMSKANSTAYDWASIFDFYCQHSLWGGQELTDGQWEALLRSNPCHPDKRQMERANFHYAVKNHIVPEHLPGLLVVNEGRATWNVPPRFPPAVPVPVPVDRFKPAAVKKAWLELAVQNAAAASPPPPPASPLPSNPSPHRIKEARQGKGAAHDSDHGHHTQNHASALSPSRHRLRHRDHRIQSLEQQLARMTRDDHEKARHISRLTQELQHLQISNRKKDEAVTALETSFDNAIAWGKREIARLEVQNSETLARFDDAIAWGEGQLAKEKHYNSQLRRSLQRYSSGSASAAGRESCSVGSEDGLGGSIGSVGEVELNRSMGGQGQGGLDRMTVAREGVSGVTLAATETLAAKLAYVEACIDSDGGLRESVWTTMLEF
ncbi:uncharacterized protein MYCFIDRAFT_180241 [Pseudocercospora fijiensis CIRAD86]|uniref:Uncharacterized protein n=1 Tax=Pseudocercospora fijiensis (strain CIRAD86) TaxID=383855 RepID=M2ZYA4_PSEFD|nr:uncharacterized protein MYCFIDRAFT_180241 [Pseudocercospora fijiensis CIRAD86]EME77096.1 hypothetical protein MYCFIDRAFT_180241 [Pseudocercospora fijiensis CIRAD86]